MATISLLLSTRGCSLHHSKLPHIRSVTQWLNSSNTNESTNGGRSSNNDNNKPVNNNNEASTTADPLFYGDLSLTSSEIPTLHSGEKIFGILEKKSLAKKLIDAPIRGPTTSLEFFQKVFPEVTEWNQVGKFTASNANWNRLGLKFSMSMWLSKQLKHFHVIAKVRFLCHF